MGSRRPLASHHHLGARAQRLSLHRRAREQSHRPRQAAGRRPDLGSASLVLGSGSEPCPSSATSSTACCFPIARSTSFRCSTAPFRPTSGSTSRGGWATKSSAPTISRSGRTERCTFRAATRSSGARGPDFAERAIFARFPAPVGGLAWTGDGRLIACVSRQGLVALSTSGERGRQTRVRGRRADRLPDLGDRRAGRDDLCDRRIARQSAGDVADGLDANALPPSGRLISCNSRLGEARVRADKLAWPSGVVVSHDGEELWVGGVLEPPADGVFARRRSAAGHRQELRRLSRPNHRAARPAITGWRSSACGRN